MSERSVHWLKEAGLLMVVALVTVAGARNAWPGEVSAGPGATPVRVDEARPKPADGPEPALEDVVPKAAEIGERLDRLKKEFPGAFDREATYKTLEEVGGRVGDLEERLKETVTGGSYAYDQIQGLREAVVQSEEELSRALQPLGESLADLERRRKDWLAARKTWAELRGGLAHELRVRSLKQTVDGAEANIATALGVLNSTAESLVEVQQKGIDVQSRAQLILDQLDLMLRTLRAGLFRKSGSAMLSPAFFEELRGPLGPKIARGLAAMRLPDRTFFAGQGWLVAAQAGLCVLLAFLLVQMRGSMGSGPGWVVLERRPLAAALFLATAIVAPLYTAPPALWALFLSILIAVTGLSLLLELVVDPARRHLLLLLGIIYLGVESFRVMELPTALFRIFVVAVSLVGAGVCYRMAKSPLRSASDILLWWSLRSGAVAFALVVGMQILGYDGFATYFLEAAIKTVFVVMFGWNVASLLRGLVEYIVRASPLSTRSILRHYADGIVSRTVHLGVAIMVFLALALVAAIWRVYDTPTEALQHVFGFGFNLGQHRVSAGMILAAVVVLYAALMISWTLQAFLMDTVYPRRKMDPGAGISVNRLVHYALVIAGFLFALAVAGVELQNITILAGAFGIGIGFGLQNIVNNFVSGLILLFERPIKVGDIVQIGQDWGEIKALGLRATVVQTFDQSEIIVPNSDLVSQQVTNWTLSDRQSRLIMPVGVAYGSNVPLVMETLGSVAAEHPMVLKEPLPQVYFMGFGNSSLDFELRVWIGDIERKFEVKSDLNQAIDRRFREAGVEIPFPQRDLHLRSVDEKAARRLLPDSLSDHEPDATA